MHAGGSCWRLRECGATDLAGKLPVLRRLIGYDDLAYVYPHSQETEKKCLGMLAGFAFFSGVGLGPVLNLCISINPSALYAQRRSFLFLGGILLSALSLLLLSSLVNIFIGSVLLFKMHMYIGLLVMCGFVLFDTQLIIEKAEHGDKDYVWKRRKNENKRAAVPVLMS
uniref:Uncharacterized protein n=1 Tax=Leptobrachium leishanense TaxID=445787 RepID=A0A8C5Q630_9ANUR